MMEDRCHKCRDEDYSRWQRRGCWCEHESGWVTVFAVAVVAAMYLLIFISGCSQLPSKVAAVAADEVVHSSRTAMNLDRRVTLLEKGTDHLRTDAELMKNSFNYTNRVIDRRLEKIETMLDRKMDRMLDMEEKILNILKDKRISGRL